MVSVGTVWDRAVDFVRDHLGAVMPVLIVTQFAAPAISGSLSGLRVGATGGVAAGLTLVSLAATLVSLWGALYLIAFAAQTTGREDHRTALGIANSRFLALLGIGIVVMIGLGVLALPGVLLMVSSGFDFAAIANGGSVDPNIVGRLGSALLYFFVLALFVLWLGARLLPLNAVVAMERNGLGAIARSFALTRGMTWKLIGLILLYGIVAGVAVSAAQFVVGAIAGLLTTDTGGISIPIIAGAIAVAAVSTVLALFQSAFIGKLYRAIVGEQDDAAVFA
ncbi:hypothetical protein DMC47_14460 [Nostoc sp. 3335mG]|nr:hypothetical protein DMC47_14460 [Nostoc sp. 3335mG]